jgi:hypothetical protein
MVKFPNYGAIMSITISDIKRYYPEAKEVKQIDSMQLFIVVYSRYSLLVSYTTMIGIWTLKNPTWLLTVKKYSRSTSRQMTRFSRYYSNTRISQDE